ncbi:hypothetical protein PCASD_23094 [Puccinia coronata f. sp. avenae]|uniref:Uncharacterized protein n=1 Tax=Puccinia coronata f. sp. avenae TaxID=200324 RepID=A0A2N5TPN3_9BASI|nr:hypothetical protein PCASD_23094 [Puccinia coronata f. sp. avenae]
MFLIDHVQGAFFLTAGMNRLNTAVRAVPKQPCSTGTVVGQPCLTGGWTGTVQRKHLLASRTGLSDQFLDRLHRTSRDRLDKSVQPVGSYFGQTVPVQPLVKHSCLSTAQTAVFNRLMPAVPGKTQEN